MRCSLPGVVRLCVLAVSLAAAGCSMSGVKEFSLEEYVNLRVGSYSWEVLESGSGVGYHHHLLRLVSQTWRTEREVDRTVWSHWLSIVIPDSVKEAAGRGESSKALLIISGGSNKGKAPAGAEEKAVEMAVGSGAVVATRGMVPTQPLGFAPELRGRYEDDLVAHTWNLYLETGDQTWLARWPMVKSAVRAMDAVEEFLGSTAAESLEKPLDISGCVVAGGSKRGWTTWLTGATDPRVSAIIPIVIDVVNVIPSMDHHYAAYGFWAPAVRDYEEQGLMARKNEGAYRDLIRLVDPYYHLDRLRMPKYIVNATGDQVFLPDSSQFYFDELRGQKNLRYVPNADHGLGGTDAIQTITAFYSLVIEGRATPGFSWKHERDGFLRVKVDQKPTEVKLWQATRK